MFKPLFELFNDIAAFMLPIYQALLVLLLVAVAIHAVWRWRNRSWLRMLDREVAGPCVDNSHVLAWIWNHRKEQRD